MDAASVESTPRTVDKRWQSLLVLCLGVLMIVVDATVVNVALPSIRADLKFTQSSLVWVVNAYGLTYGGLLLTAGRLGDLLGRRKLFILGNALFTVASLACGLAHSQALLIAARATQGVGGAVVVAVSAALIMAMFENGAERARAMSIYSFICAGGGSIGLLLGGAFTSELNWHWIFLINLPIGILVTAFCFLRLPSDEVPAVTQSVDVWGAIIIMVAATLAIEAVIHGGEVPRNSGVSLTLLICAAVTFALFLRIESRVSVPLLPLSVFKYHNLTIANIVGALWASGVSGWLFIATLYMQLVLGYQPLQVGLAFLPANLIMAVFAVGFSAKLVTRIGAKRSLAIGLLLVTMGLALFACVNPHRHTLMYLLLSMLLMGLGTGIAYTPLVLVAVSTLPPAQSGLASGIFNTTCVLGAAVGLSLLANFSTTSRNELLASGTLMPEALAGGYAAALLLGALCTGAAAVLSVVSLKPTLHLASHADSSE